MSATAIRNAWVNAVMKPWRQMPPLNAFALGLAVAFTTAQWLTYDRHLAQLAPASILVSIVLNMRWKAAQRKGQQ